MSTASPASSRFSVPIAAQAGRSRISTTTVCRVMESAAAALALACCSPVVATAAVAIRAASGRCPLVAHRRVGRNGREFWMLKLRTMWSGRDGASSPRLIEYLDACAVPPIKDPSDPRVTSRFAAMLRKFSIDELPQLLHIVSGTMSFIGPRPLTRAELATYYGDDAAEVLQRRPGMTGLWQVLGRSRLTYDQRKQLDLMLVRNWCFRLCIGILLRTPARIITGRDAY